MIGKRLFCIIGERLHVRSLANDTFGHLFWCMQLANDTSVLYFVFFLFATCIIGVVVFFLVDAC